MQPKNVTERYPVRMLGILVGPSIQVARCLGYWLNQVFRLRAVRDIG